MRRTAAENCSWTSGERLASVENDSQNAAGSCCEEQRRSGNLAEFRGQPPPSTRTILHNTRGEQVDQPADVCVLMGAAHHTFLPFSSVRIAKKQKRASKVAQLLSSLPLLKMKRWPSSWPRMGMWSSTGSLLLPSESWVRKGGETKGLVEAEPAPERAGPGEGRAGAKEGRRPSLHSAEALTCI